MKVLKSFFFVVRMVVAVIVIVVMMVMAGRTGGRMIDLSTAGLAGVAATGAEGDNALASIARQIK